MKAKLCTINLCVILALSVCMPSFGWWKSSEYVSPFEEFPIAGMRKSDPYVLDFKARRSERKSNGYMQWSFLSGAATGVTGVFHAASRLTPNPTDVRFLKGLGLLTFTFFSIASFHNMPAVYFREERQRNRQRFYNHLKGNMPPRGV